MSSRRKRRRPRTCPIALASLSALLIIASVAALAPDKPSEELPEREKITAEYAEPVKMEAHAPAPAPEPTPEPVEPVSKYEAVELTEENTYILACLVYHEARGEPFEGQVAVVEVVFNRCLSDEFPDTIEEVVFQKYGDVWQFSPAPYLYTAEPSEVQYSAVMYAYNAEEHVVPPETVFFSTSPYNEHVTAIIGNHYFCEI